MKVLFHNFYPSLNVNNLLFENFDTAIGDNLLKPFNLLAQIADKQGIELGTCTKISPEQADAFVFIDFPSKGDSVFEYAKNKEGARLFLIIMESPIVNTKNFDSIEHQRFKKIFTWSDDLIKINPKKYIKLNYSYDIPNTVAKGVREKFCIIISGNKMSRKNNELYSERLQCIKWFDKHKPNQLDLYGTNWDIVNYDRTSYYGKFMNRINAKYRIFKNNFQVYKGTIKRKSDVMPHYNFSICFENVANQSGYITEKIFDCLFSGTIPIYKGADNIGKYVPANCYIDYNNYGSPENLYRFLSTISDNEIIKYQNNIENYLRSEQVQQFSIKTFCDTLLQNIKNDD